MKLDIEYLKEKKKVLIVILIAIVLFLYHPYLMSLVPGPEGVRALNYGVQFSAYGNILKASQLESLPSNFVWGSTDPSIMSIKHIRDAQEPLIALEPSWYYDHDNGEVRSEVQRPILQDDPLGIQTQTIEYYKNVLIGDKVETHIVVAKVIPADFVIQISSVPGAGLYTFKDINLWYALDSVVWQNAYPADSNPLTNYGAKKTEEKLRGAYPIVAWIQKYQDWVWKKDSTYSSNPPDSMAVGFCQLDPSLEGRFIDLYTSPSSKYDLLLSIDIARNPDLLKENIKDKILPAGFSPTVFFRIRLVKFGAYVKPQFTVAGVYISPEYWYPSVYYRLRVVYVVAGEYVYLWDKANAEKLGYTENTWTIRTSHKEEPYPNWIDAIIKFFSSLAIGVGNIMAIIIFIIFILIALGIIFGGKEEKEK
jgi:hypothetical protein